ncbi:hypothetical protein G6F56_000972 [Rhizopus delemar]|uniref:Uncharacterized protein n=1 Tax=Rhizopus stolonifer TaxID=4846 RepID=A0A367JD32_RHIST|nr:hypothetical protein G6F56_000972 [Rhizopus delemar]RCH87830.1 hypothetical protein CU098_008457 [Rhizopus stolonifer]
MNAATVCGAYTDANCTAKKQFFTDSLNISSITYTDRVELIAGLTSGLAVLILIAVVALLCYRKRRRQQSMTFKKETQAVNVPSVSLVLTPSSLSSSKHEKQTSINYNHPDSPFIIGAHALQIPRLDIPQSPVFASDVVRRSLNLQPAAIPLSSVSRSSSVKLTKYDYDSTQTIPTLTEIRRAVSVKRNSPTNSHTSSITCVGSTRSNKLLCAKPTIVHIRRHVREEDIPVEPSSTLSLHSNTSGNINFYFSPSNTQSQVSIQSSTSHSTFGDGEITVYYDPSNNK